MLRECPQCDALVVLEAGEGAWCNDCGSYVSPEDDWTAADEQLYDWSDGDYEDS